MTQLKSFSFVKSCNLTEMSYTLSNDIWPDIEDYFLKCGGIKKWANKASIYSTDLVLQKFLFSYFKTILLKYGFFLKNFSFSFTQDSETAYGEAQAFILIKQVETEKLPLIILDLNINIKDNISVKELPRILFHELIHLEQMCKSIINMTANKLLLELPSNIPINILDLLKYDTSNSNEEVLELSPVNELSAYANDFALKLFTYYKIILKNIPEKYRDSFLRTEILPKYTNHMDKSLLSQVNSLSYDKKQYFLKQMVRQLKEFISGLL